jgi:peptidoglycan/LPS O-acetylase OafA/YrhL
MKDYRGDINTLRAFAIIAVVDFHFRLGAFSGGFCGVDVFFVVSGYLMTMIIWDKLEIGRFSLLGFYLARARRIVPALAVLCLSLLIVGAWWLDAFSYADLGAEATAALLFYSNFLFWLQSGYFDQASETKLLLHTWSLSVEWQFYLLYPVLLWLLHRLVRRATRHIVLSLALVSLALAVFTSTRRPDLDFYLLPTRAWEMAFGGLPYFYRFSERIADRWRSWAALLGWAAIVTSASLAAVDDPWPGLATVPVVIGTALVIAARARAGWLYEAAPLKIIGKWSYSIYIWHWPVLVFLAYLGVPAGKAHWAFLPLVLLLAGLSYTFIEQAGLTLMTVGAPRFGLAAAGTFALCVAAAAMVRAFDGLPTRFGGSPARVAAIAAAAEDWRYPARCGGMRGRDMLRFCTLGSGQRRVLLYGDSFAEQLYPYFAALSEQQPALKVDVVTLGGCPPLPGVNVSRPGSVCSTFSAAALRQAMSGHYDVIVIASAWVPFFRTDEDNPPPEFRLCFETASDCTRPRETSVLKTAFADAFGRLADAAAALKKAGSTVVLVETTPIPGNDTPDFYRELLRREFLRLDTSGLEAIGLADFKARTAFVDRNLEAVAARAGAQLVDPTIALCRNGRCPVLDQYRLPLYRDAAHLRASFVATAPFAELTDIVLNRKIH